VPLPSAEPAKPIPAATAPIAPTAVKRPEILMFPDPAGESELRKGLPRKLIILAVVAALIIALIIYQHQGPG